MTKQKTQLDFSVGHPVKWKGEHYTVKAGHGSPFALLAGRNFGGATNALAAWNELVPIEEVKSEVVK